MRARRSNVEAGTRAGTVKTRPCAGSNDKARPVTLCGVNTQARLRAGRNVTARHSAGPNVKGGKPSTKLGSQTQATQLETKTNQTPQTRNHTLGKGKILCGVKCQGKILCGVKCQGRTLCGAKCQETTHLERQDPVRGQMSRQDPVRGPMSRQDLMRGQMAQPAS